MSPADESEYASLVACLSERLPDARTGLPPEVFYLVSRLTPLVNVDLLICNTEGHTLLTWRNDELYGPGWHVPGGIIRFKETAAWRIAAVAKGELGAEVEAETSPCSVNEIFSKQRDVRGHFISLLYRCRLKTPLDMSLKATGQMLQNGMWQWFDRCPENLIPAHAVYRAWIGSTDSMMRAEA